MAITHHSTMHYSNTQHSTHFHHRLAGAVLACVLVPWTGVLAKPVHEQLAVDPQGFVEIVDVAGSVAVSGWDRSEIEVTGTADDGVERVEVTTSGNRSAVRVRSRSSSSVGGAGEARLTIHVPARSAVTATLVSADLDLAGLQGNVKAQTVSGDITGTVGADLRASTVSGSMRVAAAAAKVIEVKTVSGDIHVSGGGGEVEVTTISGEASLEMGAVTRARFKSVSGGLDAAFALAPDGRFEGESVSGDLVLKFAATPAADFDVQSMSGTIANCFGPKAEEAHYGPGSRLSFKSGAGGGHVQIETKSGDVNLCTQDSRAKKAAAAATDSGCGRSPMFYPAGFTPQGDRPRRFPLI